jgi:dihydrodipicolinate synthase/N-acetylneuraminate lyase
MTPFPQIQRPCPYLDRLDTVVDAGFCRMCRREVHDLTAMDERERAAFLAACGGDACVSYTMNVKPALAAALIAASTAVLAVPAAALATDHQAARSRHHQPNHRQRPVQVRNVPIMVAGGIAPPIDPRGPVLPPPTVPESPPKIPD